MMAIVAQVGGDIMAPALPERLVFDPPRGLVGAPEVPPPLVADSWLVADGRVRGLGLHGARFVAAAERFEVPTAQTGRFLRAALDILPRRGRLFPRVELSRPEAEPRFSVWLRRAPEPTSCVRVWVGRPGDPRAHPLIKGPDLPLLADLRGLARAAGADEPLILGERGEIYEGASTSLMWWRDGVLCMPPEGPHVLPGVTRALLEYAVARRGQESRTEVATPADLDGLEVWCVNALHGIRPVVQWVGTDVQPGTARLAASWQAELEAMARSLPHPEPRTFDSHPNLDLS